jgi:predicted lipoprotein with Yx(FWY)xxD motif
VRQWVFRGKPLYKRVADHHSRSFEGSDEPGWHNVFVQRAPAPPREFTIQNTRAGQVLADAQGRTIYTYICSDDSVDQLSCDHPDLTQVMRVAICGGGDPERCLRTFPPVRAAPDAKSDNRLWTVMDIDAKTGHRAAPGQPNALHVWAYRDRPVYTFSADKKAGDIAGDAWGEFTGWRNGFKAFWLRDDFFSNAG